MGQDATACLRDTLALLNRRSRQPLRGTSTRFSEETYKLGAEQVGKEGEVHWAKYGALRPFHSAKLTSSATPHP